MPFMFGPLNCGQINSSEAFDDIKKLHKAVIINITNKVFVLGIILILYVEIYQPISRMDFLNTKENNLFQVKIRIMRLIGLFLAPKAPF